MFFVKYLIFHELNHLDVDYDYFFYSNVYKFFFTYLKVSILNEGKVSKSEIALSTNEKSCKCSYDSVIPNLFKALICESLFTDIPSCPVSYLY